MIEVKFGIELSAQCKVLEIPFVLLLHSNFNVRFRVAVVSYTFGWTPARVVLSQDSLKMNKCLTDFSNNYIPVSTLTSHTSLPRPENKNVFTTTNGY